MIATANYTAARPMMLRLSTAAELMRPSPLAFDMNDSVHKAAALLSFHELEAAPVVDATGRLIGTISAEACAAWEDYSRRTSPHGFSAADLDETSILDILSPGVDTVHDDAPAREVIDTLVRRNARRVYVVNAEEELLGVISMGDVLRCLGDGAGTRRVSHAAAAHLCQAAEPGQ